VSEGLQQIYAPDSICWGCGPANPEGLHLRSFARGEEVEAQWTPGPHHAAFPGVLNGGIIGTLLDCHCNCAAALHFMRARGLDHPPVTVTADYAIRLRRPTDASRSVRLVARVAESTDNKAVVEGELYSGDEVTATCRGTFVAIDDDHPAAKGW